MNTQINRRFDSAMTLMRSLTVTNVAVLGCVKILCIAKEYR